MGKGPLVFYDSVTHFGGGYQSTVLIARELHKLCDIVVLDAYGACKEYCDVLKRGGVKTIVLKPNPIRPLIGGNTKLERVFRYAMSIPRITDLLLRLRRTLKELSPRAIWTNQNKALFLLSRAVGDSFPLAFYTRGEGYYPVFATRRDWKRLSLILGISESCFSSLRGSPYEAPIMEIVPNGIDIDETIALSSAEVPELPLSSGLRFLYPGTYSEVKDQATAIRGLAEYVNNGGDATLWLCGSVALGGPMAYQEELRKLADELDVSDRVHFLGWRDNVPSIMAQCDIVLLTSVTEGFGRVLLEAMCLRKPIIATRVGGIPEVVRDGVDGILFESRDSKGFARAVEKLADPEVREKMGEAGFERVTTNYAIKKVASCFLKVISKIG